MWEIIKLILAGLAGGVLGGMGMGGGTLLIPLLTVFCKVPQHAAQAVNLAAFVPMAGIALIIHFKKKLVDVRGVLWIIIPSCAAAVGAAFLAKGIQADLLKRLFGGFIIALGIYQIVCEIITKVKEKKEKKQGGGKEQGGAENKQGGADKKRDGAGKEQGVACGKRAEGREAQ